MRRTIFVDDVSIVPCSSLCCNHELTAGKSEGSPDHGNNGGWKPRMHWKGVIPVDGLQSEFWAYSAIADSDSSRTGFYGSINAGSG